MPSPAYLKISKTISIPHSEIKERFVRASGPGGQNVNKVSTAVQLKYDINRSKSLSLEVKDRLNKIAKNIISSQGQLIILARKYSTQEKNRSDAYARLVNWVKKALIKPKPRKPTKIPKSVIKKRLDNKKKTSEKKGNRKKVTY